MTHTVGRMFAVVSDAWWKFVHPPLVVSVPSAVPARRSVLPVILRMWWVIGTVPLALTIVGVCVGAFGVRDTGGNDSHTSANNDGDKPPHDHVVTFFTNRSNYIHGLVYRLMTVGSMTRARVSTEESRSSKSWGNSSRPAA